jgi:hypothetical protein
MTFGIFKPSHISNCKDLTDYNEPVGLRTAGPYGFILYVQRVCTWKQPMLLEQIKSLYPSQGDLFKLYTVENFPYRLLVCPDEHKNSSNIITICWEITEILTHEIIITNDEISNLLTKLYDPNLNILMMMMMMMMMITLFQTVKDFNKSFQS